MNGELEAERRQLVDHWRRRLQLSPQLEFVQARRILDASNGDERARKSLGDDLRHFHDKFGYKAKGKVRDGGLCSGAIYRTGLFIKTRERNGSKKAQSVHIEHTFPVNELRSQIENRRFKTYFDAIAWVLMHSVTTAFHESQKQHLTGRASNSNALNPASPEYLKPFVRYEKLHSADENVWNVFDLERIDPQEFTFEHHFDVVLRLLREAGAAPEVVAAIYSASAHHQSKTRSSAPPSDGLHRSENEA
jgi:hypothetical protein